MTPYHAKFWARELARRAPADSVDRLATALVDAQVDLNPHQVDAALLAFRSPLSKGVLLADEVWLGKTIEAGLVIAQKWAERRRRVLVITPSNLRKQWHQERHLLLPVRAQQGRRRSRGALGPGGCGRSASAAQRLQAGHPPAGRRHRRNGQGPVFGGWAARGSHVRFVQLRVQDLGGRTSEGGAGWLRVTALAIESLDQAEVQLLFAAARADGSPVDADAARRLRRLLEAKPRNKLADPEAAAKNEAAQKWCGHASDHTSQNGGKPWKYALIPDDVVDENMTLDFLVAQGSP